MNTLLVHPVDKRQEKALKVVFDAMNVNYENDIDTTQYLLSNPAMKAHLQESMKQAKEGKVKTIALDKLWK